jgi:hypothetical protein
MKENDIIKRVDELYSEKLDNTSWFAKLYNEEPIVLSVLNSRNLEPSQRDSIKSIIDTKLNEKLIGTFENLNKSATRLQKIGIALSVIIGLAAIAITFFS